MGIPPGCMLTQCHTRVLSPRLLQAGVPALGLAPMPTLFVVVKHRYSGFICTFYLCKLSCAVTACKPPVLQGLSPLRGGGRAREGGVTPSWSLLGALQPFQAQALPGSGFSPTFSRCLAG